MEHDILAFRLNDMKPFLSHRDAVNDRLEEAHALCIAFGGMTAETESAFNELNPQIKYAIFRSIESLIAYAQFHLDAAEGGASREA